MTCHVMLFDVMLCHVMYFQVKSRCSFPKDLRDERVWLYEFQFNYIVMKDDNNFDVISYFHFARNEEDIISMRTAANWSTI